MPPLARILEQYRAGVLIRDIAADAGVRRQEINKILRKERLAGHIAGYRKSGGHETTRHTPLTDHQMQVIDGLLLGDGCIRKSRMGVNPMLMLTNIQRQFIERTQAILAPLIFHINTKPACTSMFPKGRVGRCKESYQLCSHVDRVLLPILTRWRPNGGPKHIPNDLVITPAVMLYWFYGDGSTSYHKQNGLSMNFATQGFTSEECNFLAQRVHNACGIAFAKHKSGGHYCLELTRGQEVGCMLDWMLDGSEPLECFRYKWKYQTLTGPLKGEAHPRSRLKEQDIHAIFELRKRGWLQREIAECLAISPSHANMILCGHKWQHLKDDYAT